MVTQAVPSVFHITHPKGGSQWIKGILRDIAQERVRLDADAYLNYFFKEPIKPGSVYPTIYTSKPAFEIVMGLSFNYNAPLLLENQKQLLRHRKSYFLNWFRFRMLGYTFKKFFMIRDFRDTLISFYFSMKNTHLIMRDAHQAFRSTLGVSTEEAGLLHIINSLEFQDYAKIQRSWMGDPDTPVIKFEDLVVNPMCFETILRHCEIEISSQELERILDKNDFNILSGGRKRGSEDQNSHYRKGVSGDWKNHFTDIVKDEFKKKYGQLLIATGYEGSLDW